MMMMVYVTIRSYFYVFPVVISLLDYYGPDTAPILIEVSAMNTIFLCIFELKSFAMCSINTFTSITILVDAELTNVNV